LDRWDPNVFLAALVAGVAALVVVSLMTSPEPEQRLVSLFDRLETASDTPADSGAKRPLLLVNALHLRSAAAGRGWRAFAEDQGGLAAGSGLVVALVMATAWLLAL
jgi:hypothetical protein